MQPLDFIYVVLPLGTIVIVLVAVVLLSESRKERRDKKIKRAVEKITKEKEEKQQAFKTQQAELDKLSQEKAIDSDTYQRLSKLMQMSQKNLDDTVNELIYAENIGKKNKPKKAAKVAPQIQI